MNILLEFFRYLPSCISSPSSGMYHQEGYLGLDDTIWRHGKAQAMVEKLLTINPLNFFLFLFNGFRGAGLWLVLASFNIGGNLLNRFSNSFSHGVGMMKFDKAWGDGSTVFLYPSPQHFKILEKKETIFFF
jgi:hypothetical protein